MARTWPGHSPGIARTWPGHRPDLARAWWGAFTDISTAVIAGLRAETVVMEAERKLFAGEADDSPVVILGRRMEDRYKERRLH